MSAAGPSPRGPLEPDETSASAVLIVRPSSMGDVVYALAVVADLRRHRPELAIDWVAERSFVPLVGLAPDVRRIVPFGLRGWRRAPFDPATWREMRAFRRELTACPYAAVIDLQEQVKGAVIARAARGRRHGFDRASVREPLGTLAHDVHHRVPRDVHFVERSRRLVAAALGYRPDGPPRWRLAPPATAPGLPARPYAVALHATSRAAKLWPEEHWRALIARLAQAGYATVLPWGSAEEEARSRRLATGAQSAIVPPRLSLPDAAAYLVRAAVVIGVDTGLTHLAAVLGTPTVGLFLATDPVLAGVAVTGAHARDVGREGVVPGVDEVIEAAGALARAAPAC